MTAAVPVIPPSLLRLALPKPGFFSRLRRTVEKVGVTFDEVYEDARHVIRSCGSLYSDEAHPILNLDNLVSEGLAKLAEMTRSGILAKMKSRLMFFSYLKTSIKRHLFRFVRSQKMTLKRTGVSAPGKGATEAEMAAYRATLPREISLDAPTQRGETEETSHDLLGAGSQPDERLIADLREILGPQDLFVFDQMLEPNEAAWCYARGDCHWDSVNDCEKPYGIPVTVKVEYRHMAAGIQMTLPAFLEVVNRIKSQVKNYMQTGDIFHDEHSAALRRLEEFFALRHIPRTVDAVIVRRLLTVAARDNYQRVTPEIVGLLQQVGAKVPQLLSQTLSCFGVMFQANNPLCGRCGRRTACAVEAANVGLGEITLSPVLLGAKTTRIPAIVAGEPVSDPVFADETMEEVYAYLTENFHRVVAGGEHYFRHNGWLPVGGITSGGMSGLIFHIQGQKLRFCKPSPALSRKLQSQRSAGTAGESLSLPDDVTVNEAIDLVSQHAKETLSDKHAETAV